MSLGKFLTSFTFFKQLFLAIVITVVFLFALIKFLDFRTNHGEEINVPDLSKMKLEVAEEKLDEDILTGKIVFSTFHQVKGLERKVVIIYNFDNSYFIYYEKDKSPFICPNTIYVPTNEIMAIYDAAEKY